MAIGVLTVVPLLSTALLFLYFYLYPTSYEALALAGDIVPTLYVGPTWGLKIAAFGTLLGLLLYFFYLVWAVRTSKFTMMRKLVWVVLLSFAGLVTMPVFWWCHLRPESNT